MIDVSNVCQTSVDFVLFEFYVNFTGYLKDWFKIRMEHKLLTTPLITTIIDEWQNHMNTQH